MLQFYTLGQTKKTWVRFAPAKLEVERRTLDKGREEWGSVREKDGGRAREGIERVGERNIVQRMLRLGRGVASGEHGGVTEDREQEKGDFGTGGTAKRIY